jgi:hypothetical protein
VERNNRVEVWVGPTKISTLRREREGWGTQVETGVKIPTLSQSARQEWGTQVKAPKKSYGKKSYRTGMDITWLTDRIAVGGGIWTSENMAKVAKAGITHIIDMQIEFDDTPLGKTYSIEVLWNPTDDDFEAKPAWLFQRGVDFAEAALEGTDAKLFIHCAAGVHRAPMMALAILGSMGWSLKDAMELIQGRRPVADFADVYVRSVEEFLGNSSE